jgi:hypothetical protein
MKYLLITAISISCLTLSCDTLSEVGKELGNQTVEAYSLPSSLEINNGLKEALTRGTDNAVGLLNKSGGYQDNPLMKIPFPKEVDEVAEKLKQLGMTKLVSDFEQSINKAAENAAAKAKPIFVNAITSMSFADAKAILTGGNGAATNYFKSKTSQRLEAAFKPEINKALNAVNATKYWTDITTAYNRIPMLADVEADLSTYVTDKAMEGLFLMIEQEENKIRQDPAARVTELLKKVFGSRN